MTSNNYAIVKKISQLVLQVLYTGSNMMLLRSGSTYDEIRNQILEKKRNISLAMMVLTSLSS